MTPRLVRQQHRLPCRLLWHWRHQTRVVRGAESAGDVERLLEGQRGLRSVWCSMPSSVSTTVSWSLPGYIMVHPRSLFSATGWPGFPTLCAVLVLIVTYSLAPKTTCIGI